MNTKLRLLVITLLALSLMVFPLISSAQKTREDTDVAGQNTHYHSDRDTLYLLLPQLSSHRVAQVSVTNLAEESGDVTITAFDAAGQQLGKVASERLLDVGEKGFWNREQIPEGTTLLKIESQHSISAKAVLISKNGDGEPEIVPALRETDARLNFPPFGNDQLGNQAVRRSINIANPNQYSTEIEAVAINFSGQEVGRKKLPALAAMTSATLPVGELFGDLTGAEQFSVRIESTSQIVGLESGVAANGNGAILPALVSTSRVWNFPVEQASLRSASVFNLGLFNSGEEEATIKISAFDAEGNEINSETIPTLAARQTSFHSLNNLMTPNVVLISVSASQAISSFTVEQAPDGSALNADIGKMDLGTVWQDALSIEQKNPQSNSVSSQSETLQKLQRNVQSNLRANAVAIAPESDGFDFPIGTTGNATESWGDSDGWNVQLNFLQYYSAYGKYHLGEDWNGDGGGNTDCQQPVYSVSKGVIQAAGTATGWGKYMIIRHRLPGGTEVETLYGHLYSFERTSGEVGKRQLIGKVGDGGGLYPCHLHLEVRYSNCSSWGLAGPGYWSNTTTATGWTDPTNFINARRSFRRNEGYVDRLVCDRIEGWAWDSGLPNTPVNVDIYDGGTRIATVTANIYRSDLFNAGKGNGYHGFSLATPASLKNGQYHTVSAYISGTSFELTGSGGSLYCASTVITAANIYYPANGTTLSSSTATFYWDAGSGITGYWLYVGTTPGGSQLYNSDQGTGRSRTVYNIPTNGQRVYVRLWSWTGSTWQYRDYSYGTVRR